MECGTALGLGGKGKTQKGREVPRRLSVKLLRERLPIKPSCASPGFAALGERARPAVAWQFHVLPGPFAAKFGNRSTETQHEPPGHTPGPRAAKSDILCMCSRIFSSTVWVDRKVGCPRGLTSHAAYRSMCTASIESTITSQHDLQLAAASVIFFKQVFENAIGRHLTLTVMAYSPSVCKTLVLYDIVVTSAQ